MTSGVRAGRRLSDLAGRTFDLVVVGGGIIGAGVARDAARRGLSVALVEQQDYASGTTAGSTRLIHGGLRYLEMFDFPLVRLDLRERETLLRIAPHLVRPLEFLLPFYDESLWARFRLRAGMWLYDALSYDKSLPRHRELSAADLRRLEPSLETRGLQGGASYFDAQALMPERLCLENILDARAHGARAANYARADTAVVEGDRIVGVRVTDMLGQEGEVELRGRLVVNATGAWLDRVTAGLGLPAGHPSPVGHGRRPEGPPISRPRIRTTKGIHITCPPTTGRALAVPSAVDGRLVFVIPWLGYSWIGTTDTDFDGDPSTARATGDDVRYVVASVRRYVPVLGAAPVYFTNAGVRALVRQSGSESSVTRSHRIVDGERDGLPGLISVVGGKLTGYRAIAEEVTDMVCMRLGSTARSSTQDAPLPGAAAGRAFPTGSDTAVPLAVHSHLTSLYGRRAGDIVRLIGKEPELAAPLATAYPDVAGQVALAARDEQCERLADFMLRRTCLGFSPDQGRQAVEAIAVLLGRELGWGEARRAEEIAGYLAHVDRTQQFRVE